MCHPGFSTIFINIFTSFIAIFILLWPALLFLSIPRSHVAGFLTVFGSYHTVLISSIYLLGRSEVRSSVLAGADLARSAPQLRTAPPLAVTCSPSLSTELRLRLWVTWGRCLNINADGCVCGCALLWMDSDEQKEEVKRDHILMERDTE